MGTRSTVKFYDGGYVIAVRGLKEIESIGELK